MNKIDKCVITKSLRIHPNKIETFKKIFKDNKEILYKFNKFPEHYLHSKSTDLEIGVLIDTSEISIGHSTELSKEIFDPIFERILLLAGVEIFFDDEDYDENRKLNENEAQFLGLQITGFPEYSENITYIKTENNRSLAYTYSIYYAEQMGDTLDMIPEKFKEVGLEVEHITDDIFQYRISSHLWWIKFIPKIQNNKINVIHFY